jgi:hypothetical protein
MQQAESLARTMVKLVESRVEALEGVGKCN